MEIRMHMLKSLIISFIALALVVLIVLFPRHLNIHNDGYGLSAPPVQVKFSEYLDHISDFFSEIIATKSLGDTRNPQVTAEEAAISSMSRSIVIIMFALLLGTVLGTLKGVMDYKLSKTRFNVLGNWTTWLFQSIPDFLLLLLIQWITIRYIRWLPFFPQGEWYDFILPSVLVSIYPIIYLARITSASIAMQEGELYIRVARAKGLTEFVILFKHMLRNSISTILTHLPSLFVYILSNLLMVEIFMNYPGAANRLFLAIDYSRSFGTGPNYEPGVIIGIATCFMVLFLIVQFISQAAKRYLDPR